MEHSLLFLSNGDEVIITGSAGCATTALQPTEKLVVGFDVSGKMQYNTSCFGVSKRQNTQTSLMGPPRYRTALRSF